MKKCPFCAEEIQVEAIKCRYCGEFLESPQNRILPKKDGLPWYFAKATVIIAILTVGPLALPLVWVHPKYSVATKIWVSALTLALTAALTYYSIYLYKNLMEQISSLGY